MLLFHVAIRLNYLFWGTRESFVSLVLVKRSLFFLVMVSWWLLLRLKNWKLSFPPFKKENQYSFHLALSSGNFVLEPIKNTQCFKCHNEVSKGGSDPSF